MRRGREHLRRRDVAGVRLTPGTRNPVARFGRALALALAAGLAVTAVAAVETSAQGRFEDKSEAEKLFIAGQRLEDEAVSLQANDPGEAKDRFEDAIDRYTEALKLEPGMIDAYVRLGYVYYALEDTEKARKVLDPAIKRWPASIGLKRVYGTVLFGIKGERDTSVANLESVAAENKDEQYFDVIFLLGKHYYEAGDNKRAAAMFRRYLKQKPEDLKIHGTLGNIYFKTEKFEPALAEFRLVLSLDANNLPARINIANIYFKKQDYPKAIELYTRLLKDKPKEQGVRFNLASSYYQTGAYDKALATYKVFVAARPKLPVGHYWQGLCHAQLKQPADARAAFDKTIRLDPNHAMAYWRLGLLDLADGKLDTALERLQKAHAIDGKNAWILMGLGDAHRKRGELDKAVARHREAVKLAPAETEGYLGLGRDLFALADLDGAVQAFEAAWKINSKEPTVVAAYTVALIHRGQGRLVAGKLPEAEADGKLALELTARPLSAHLLLAAIADARKDLPGAESHINAAAKIDSKQPNVRHALARLALTRNDGAAAVTLLEGLTEGGKTQELGVANDLARAYTLTHQWAKALQWYAAARSLGMDKARSDRNIALASLYLGEEEGSRGNWRQALTAFESTAQYEERLTTVESIRLDLDLGIAYAETGAFPKALRKLGGVGKKIRALPPEEQRLLPGADDLALDLRLAYVQYRIGKMDDAIRLLERVPMRGRYARTVQQLLVSGYVRQANAFYRSGKPKPAEELLRKAAKIARGDEVVEHNLAVIEYAGGKGKHAATAFKALAASGTIPAAIFNYAIYLDDIKKDKRGAFDLYLKYLKVGGPEAAAVQTFVDAKKRVFGFTPEGP